MLKKKVPLKLYTYAVRRQKLSNNRPTSLQPNNFENLKLKVLAVAEKYENFVGLKDVKSAQEHVQQAENLFLAARVQERTVMRNLLETREKLRTVREELSQVKYSSPTYLQLANKQHGLVNEEESLTHQLQTAEDDERLAFTNLSNAMRESYEKERIRVENTKNWSLFGTVFGTLIGMFGSIYMNRMRTKDLLKVVTEKNEAVAENLNILATSIKDQHEGMVNNLNTLDEQMERVSSEIQVQNMRAMAGFVNSKEENLSGSDKRPALNLKVLENLQEEMKSYNEALNCIVNSVNALTLTKPLANTQISGNHSSSESEEVFKYLNAISDQVLSLYEFCLKDIQPTLCNIKQLLEKDSNSKQINLELNKIVDLEEPPSSNFPIKPILWFGTIICAMYLFIKV